MSEPTRVNEEPSERSATSASLLARVLARDNAAWDRLLALYAPLVLHWCRAAGLQDQDQADILQEVFQAVAGGLPHFEKLPAGSFRGWLRTITRNKVCDLYRKRQREPLGAGGSEAQRWLNQVPEPAFLEEDSEAEQDAERALVQRALEFIRPEFAERTWQAFWRTAVEGQPAPDVAEELGLSPGAVRVAKCRVLQRLREELGDAGGTIVTGL
jgi:RNA polymerase sigma-70 factor (ECF subfamily)